MTAQLDTATQASTLDGYTGYTLGLLAEGVGVISMLLALNQTIPAKILEGLVS